MIFMKLQVNGQGPGFGFHAQDHPKTDSEPIPDLQTQYNRFVIDARHNQQSSKLKTVAPESQKKPAYARRPAHDAQCGLLKIGLKCHQGGPSMADSPRRGGNGSRADIRDLKWSAAEKAIARKAFNLALQREIEIVIRKSKDRAAKIEQPSELWELEHYLTRSRQGIDSKFDFRYSILPLVFGNLIREGRLHEQELRGLGEDKLAYIRRLAKP